MIIELLTPEEEILAWFEKALLEELPEMIQTINEEQGETWVEEINNIGKTENQSSLLPNAEMTITKVKKKTVDINFTKEEYIMNMTIHFPDNKLRVIGYRYNYLINKLVKESADLQKTADKIIIEEMEYRQNQKEDEREPAQVILKIIFTRETA